MKVEKNQQNEFNNPAKSSPNVKEIAQEKKPQRKAEKKKKRMKRNSIIFVTLQAILSVLFLGSMFALDLLPLSYVIGILLMVILLFVITWITQKQKKVGRIFGRIHSACVMILLLCASLCMGMANYILGEIADAPYKAAKEKVDLMSMETVASISEDPFCFYVQDMKTGNMSIEGATDTQLLLSVNIETHQVLRIATPESCFVTVPGVTEGKKEKLGKAGEKGVEASISALSSLYETKIPYYLKVDTKRLAQLQSLEVEGLSWDEVTRLFQDVLKADDYVQTNMKKSEVKQLIKMWIQDQNPWEMETVVVTGKATKSATYSSPKDKVMGIVPDAEQVKEIIRWIDRMEEDEVLRDVNPIILE